MPIDPLDAAIDAVITPAPAASLNDEADPLDRAIDSTFKANDEAAQRQAQMIRWREANAAVDPVRQADVLRYAAAAKLEPRYVAENLDAVKRQVDANAPDWQDVAAKHPVIIEALADPTHGPVSKDDVANLKTIDWSLNPVRMVGNSWLFRAPLAALRDSLMQQETIARQGAEAAGAGSEENRARIESLEKDYGAKDYGADSWLSKGWIGLPKMLPMLAGDLAFRQIGAVIGGALSAPAAAGGGAATVETGPGAIGGAAAGAAGMTFAGQFAGSFVFNSYQSLGPLYWQISKLKDADGNPIDPRVAQAYALAGSAVNGVIGAGLLGKVGGSLPGVKAALSRVGAVAAQKALEQATKGEVAKRFLNDYGEAVFVGAATMALQGTTNAAAVEASKTSVGQQADPWAVGEAGMESFTTGLQDLSLFAATGPGRAFLADVGQMRRSQDNAARLQVLVDAASKSTTLDRSPESFERVLRGMAQDGEAKVFVPVEDWVQLFQGKNQDPGEVAALVLGDGGKAFAEATATKGDLAIPVEKYLSKFAKSDLAADLTQLVRLNQDDLSPKQVKTRLEALDKRAGELAKAKPEEMPPDQRAVFEDYAKKAVEAGVDAKTAEANATLWSAFWKTQAERVSAEQVKRGEAPVSASDLAGRIGYAIHGSGRPDSAMAMAAQKQGALKQDVALDGGPVLRLEQGSAKQDARGSISFTLPGEGPRQFSISLGGRADRSTLAHETMHMMGEVLGDLATAKDAPASIREDYASILKAMDYASHEERAAATKERLSLAAVEKPAPEQAARLKELTAREEKLTGAWERYLGEGKAPSPELAPVFMRFRNWLLSIYKGIKNVAMGDSLNDDLRRTFDRLLVGDEAIRRAQAEVESQPVPEALARMTEPERAAYAKALDGERGRATDRLLDAIRDSEAREGEGFFAEERARLTEEVNARLDSSPEAQAVKVLRESGYPESEIAKVEREQNRNRAKDVRAEVDRRLREAFGPDLMHDPSGLAEKALDAVHDEASARRVVLEIRALARALDPSSAAQARILDPAQAKVTADRLIEEKATGDVDPRTYARAERANAIRAAELAAKGDTAGAIDQKEAQLLNQALYRAARKASEDVAKAEKLFKKAQKDTWRDDLGKASPAYRNASDAVMQALGLVDGQADPSTVDALLAQAAADMKEIAFDAEALRDLFTMPAPWSRKPSVLDRLSVAEARNVADAVASIRHIAMDLQSVTIAGQKVALDAVRAEMKATAIKSKGILKSEALDAKAAGKLEAIAGAFKHGTRGLDAVLLSPETMLETLGGFDEGSIFHRGLIHPWMEARNREVALSKKFGEAIRKKFEEMPAELRDRRFQVVDGIEKDLPVPKELLEASNKRQVVTRSWLWMVALNMGNSGNRQRLLDGMGWNEKQVKDALGKHMTKAELGWVQEVWNSLEGLYPEIAKMHEQDTGLPLGKVEATPLSVTLATGETVTLPGGYFPAKADPRPGFNAREMTDAQAIAQVEAPGLFWPATAKGHTQARAQSAKYVINLDWSVVPAHVSQVIHDLTHRQFVRQSAKLVLDPGVQAHISKTLGEEYAKTFKPWLGALASEQSDSMAQAMGWVDRQMGGLRSKAVTAAIGTSLATALGDLANPAAAFAKGEVSAKHLAKATLACLPTRWKATRAWALEQSPELQTRASKAVHNLRKNLSDMGGTEGMKSGARRFVEDSSFYFMEVSDARTATPVWVGRYNQEIAAGTKPADAVIRADAAVRRTFPAETNAEKSAILRAKNTSTLLMFYGYFNKLYNMNRTLYDRMTLSMRDPAKSGGQKAASLAEFVGRTLALALATGPASEFLSGRGKEEDEEWVEWFARKTLLAPVSSVPFIGQAIEGLVLGKPVSMRAAPAIDAAASVGKHAMKLYEHGKEGELEAYFDALALVGFFGTIPTRQVMRTGKYLAGIATGEIRPKGAGDVAGGLVYGEREGQPANLGKVISGSD